MKCSLCLSALGLLVMLGFSSCAQNAGDWQMHDPNDGATLAGDMSNPRYYTPDSEGTERRALEDWEERGTKQKNGTRFTGEVSVGVASRF